ncbi:MAG: hypothetical protein OES20_13235 [Gammaproteobacteria bacterium]|nr:hypothetical protein [Gammaproteobacteria bacterium]
MASMEYFQLTENSDLPNIEQFAPFKVVLAIENPTSRDRQLEISNWLVRAGGKYVMICGEDCESWEQIIRQVNLDQVDLDHMQPGEFVMITVHKHERLRNVFWHAKKHAHHTHVKFDHILTIHIGNQNRSVEYQSMFGKA